MKRAGWFITGAVAALIPVAAAGRLTAGSRVMLGLFIAGAVLGMVAAVMCMGGEEE